MDTLSTQKTGCPLMEVQGIAQRKNGRKLLEGVSLDLCPGQLLALIGPSGGGKSTLLRLLNRLDEMTAGRILLRGDDIRQLPVTELRRKVAMVMQKPVMFAGSVLQNLQSPFALRREPPPVADSPQLNQVLELCGLNQDFLGRPAEQLSIGQQQRVSLARALLTEPQLLLLDEPTSALDRPAADRLGELLYRLCRQRQIAVLMITHDLRLAERIADWVVFLQGGELIEQGKVEILKAPQTAELQQFLDDPELIREQTEEPA